MQRFQRAKTAQWHPAAMLGEYADSRDTLAVLLTLAGHDVRTAPDGVAALKAAAELRPDVVFLDISMPRLDGYAVCRQLRHSAACRDIPIYAITGLSGPQIEQRCREAGFTAVLTKPLEPAALARLD
jgi:CheY-like chemotaxis protein